MGSKANFSSIRAPMVWEKPTAGLYNYHYEIDGLYYQPMISYCMGRSAGARRKVVDVPDRIMSNFDKRSYKLKDDSVDYEGFLTDCYKRRMKEGPRGPIVLRSKFKERTNCLEDKGMMLVMAQLIRALLFWTVSGTTGARMLTLIQS